MPADNCTAVSPPPLPTVVIVADTVHCEGGAAKVAITSAISLSRRGLRVIYVGGFGTPDPGLDAAGVKIVNLGQTSISIPEQRLAGAIKALWNRGAARALDDILTNLPADQTVVHVHTWTKALSSSVIPVIKRHKMPLVLTLHEYFTVCPNGGFYDYQANTICHRTPMSAACVMRHCDSRHALHKVWRTVRQTIQSTAGKLPAAADAFIAASDFSLSVLRPYLPDGIPVHRVDNPIDCDQRPPAEPDRQQGVLFVGRLSQEKGPHVLAAAARDAGLRVTFAGDGELKAPLEARYPEHHFAGWCTPDNLQPLINASRAIILPSLWYETVGLVVLEAAARGVPAIVSTSCAARDVVAFEETGLGVTAGSQAELAAALRRLSDDKLVKRLGNTAYDRYWAAPPTPDRHVDKLLAVYASLAQHDALGQPEPISTDTLEGRA